MPEQPSDPTISLDRMRPGARKLLEVCTRTRAGETVAIVTDPTHRALAEPLFVEAQALGARPVVLQLTPRTADGREPPAHAAALLKACDVFFTPIGISITHTRALRDAREAGARGLVMSAFRPEMYLEGGIESDFVADGARCRAVGEILAKGQQIRLTTPGGTDLRCSIAGRRGNALTGLAIEAGEFSTMPTIEANSSPVEGSAEGVIVADASLPYLGIGLLDEPVTARVEGGSIVAIEGGVDARTFADKLESQGDPHCYNIAEVGIGLNPSARLCGWMLEDEGVWGVVHIGIGSSIQLGGTVVAPTHYDLLMRGATLHVDDVEVLRDGEVMIEA